jgi:hypothetical protein
MSTVRNASELEIPKRDKGLSYGYGIAFEATHTHYLSFTLFEYGLSSVNGAVF